VTFGIDCSTGVTFKVKFGTGVPLEFEKHPHLKNVYYPCMKTVPIQTFKVRKLFPFIVLCCYYWSRAGLKQIDQLLPMGAAHLLWSAICWTIHILKLTSKINTPITILHFIILNY